MFPDTLKLSARASGLRRSAADLRSRASAVVVQVEHAAWSSRSGDALRASTRSMIAELGRRAHHLDDAAGALEAHVRAVERITVHSSGVAQ